jgi:hypothetical protein
MTAVAAASVAANGARRRPVCRPVRQEQDMKKALMAMVLMAAVGMNLGCDDIEIEDVSLSFGGLFQPAVVYEPAPYYYEEVVEEYWYDDYYLWP